MAALVAAPGWSGIQYLEIGAGSSAWDGNPLPPVPSAAETALITPLTRVPLTGFQFLTGAVDGATGRYTIQSTPSRFALLNFYVAQGVATGTWREFAIVGGNATAVTGTGLYLAVVRFPARVRGSSDDPKIEQIALYL